MYKKDSNSTLKDIHDLHRNINSRARENPDDRILIVFVLAAHGQIKDGKQVVVLNEFNKKEGRFNSWSAEESIRDRAKIHPNTYQICIFACCREVFRTEVHCGNFLGTETEAVAHYTKLLQDECLMKQKGIDNEQMIKSLQSLNESLCKRIEQQEQIEKERLESEKKRLEQNSIEEKKTDDNARGNTEIDKYTGTEKFAFVFGCRPSFAVKADTAMVEDICTVLIKNLNRESMSVIFPDFLNSLIGKDAAFELVASSTLPPLKLFYNSASEFRCYIFVHSGYKSNVREFIQWTGTIDGGL